MARAITVYRETDDEVLYEEPLGSEAAIREFWSEPAAELGLPLIASIYGPGFYGGIRWSGTELAQLLAELGKLQQHWSSASLPPEIAADLAERARYLRAAVTLAESCGGFIDIT